MSETIQLEADQPIDFSAVLDRIGGDTSFLQDLLNLYFHEFDEKKELLEKALSRGDSTQIQEVGHSLKGASANLSLIPLQKLGLAIETAGGEKNLDRAREAIGALGPEFQRLKAFLEMHPPGKQA
ncbi:MAG: Hpt domain-containing protein [Candidatus Aminicenantales bacterium]